MPNWIRTIVRTDEDTMQDIKERFFENGALSFNRIIPMPEELNVEHSTDGANGLIYLYYLCTNSEIKPVINEVYKSLNPFNMDIEDDPLYDDVIKHKVSLTEKKECIDLANKYMSNYINYGHNTWYEWHIDKWGTKWDINDNDFECNNDTMLFDTAGCFAANAIIELSKHYPEAEFECKYADEDIYGGNTGCVTYQNGEITTEPLVLSADEAIEIWNTDLQESSGFKNPRQSMKDIEDDFEL